MRFESHQEYIDGLRAQSALYDAIEKWEGDNVIPLMPLPSAEMLAMTKIAGIVEYRKQHPQYSLMAVKRRFDLLLDKSR